MIKILMIITKATEEEIKKPTVEASAVFTAYRIKSTIATICTAPKNEVFKSRKVGFLSFLWKKTNIKMIVKKKRHVMTLKGAISAPIIFNNGYERPQPTATEVRAKRAVECFIDINQNLYRS